MRSTTSSFGRYRIFEYEKKIISEERAKAEEHAEEIVKDLKRVEKLIQREQKLQTGDPKKNSRN